MNLLFTTVDLSIRLPTTWAAHVRDMKRSRRFVRVMGDHRRVFPLAPFNVERCGYGNRLNVCFEEAYKAARKFGLLYCEGLMWMHVKEEIPILGGNWLPTPHGWCADPDTGKILDPTRYHHQHRNEIVRYEGVALRLSYIDEWKRRVGYAGCLDGHYLGQRVGVEFDPPTMWLEECNAPSADNLVSSILESP